MLLVKYVSKQLVVNNAKSLQGRERKKHLFDGISISFKTSVLKSNFNSSMKYQKSLTQIKSSFKHLVWQPKHENFLVFPNSNIYSYIKD